MTGPAQACARIGCTKRGALTDHQRCPECGFPTRVATTVAPPVSADEPEWPAARVQRQYAPPGLFDAPAVADVQPPTSGGRGPKPTPTPVAMWINAIFFAPLFGLGLITLQFQFARNRRRALAYNIPTTKYVVPWLVGFWPIVALAIFAAVHQGASTSSNAVPGIGLTQSTTTNSAGQPSAQASGSLPTILAGTSAAVDLSADTDPLGPGVDSGVTIAAGQTLVVSATGDATYGADADTTCTGTPTVDPRGDRQLNGSSCPPKFDPAMPVPTAPVGALIARVGGGDWFSPAEPTVAQTSGRVFLGFNDSTVSDNTGGYSVQLQVR